MPLNEGEEAIVTGPSLSETEHEGGGRREEAEEEGLRNQESSMFSFKSFLWHGGSVWDAWFSCASNQVSLRNPFPS